MHAFLSGRSPPIEGPVAAKVRREFCAFVVRRAGKAERQRDLEADLVERSRLAIAQSIALLSRVSDVVVGGFDAEVSEHGPEHPAPVLDRRSRWQDLLADGLGDRFFFDVDDGELTRRDAVGMVLESRDDVPHETRAVLFDLAYAAIPLGRMRLFTATVRDERGRVIYKGSMTVKPSPNV